MTSGLMAIPMAYDFLLRSRSKLRDSLSRSTSISPMASEIHLAARGSLVLKKNGRWPTSKRAGIHTLHASSAASSTEGNNHNRISVFTRSPAENDILFTNVNVEIDKNNLVVDSESVDAPISPENFRYPCSSRLGVTYHPYHPYTPCAARTKTSTPPRHSGSTKKPPLTVPESPHCTDQIGGGIGTGKRG